MILEVLLPGMNTLSNFLKEARQELLRVNWPSRKETVRLTVIVIGLSLGFSVFLGLADFLFTAVLKNAIL